MAAGGSAPASVAPPLIQTCSFAHLAGMAVLPYGYNSLLQVAVAGVKDAFEAARWGLQAARGVAWWRVGQVWHCWAVALDSVVDLPLCFPQPQ